MWIALTIGLLTTAVTHLLLQGAYPDAAVTSPALARVAAYHGLLAGSAALALLRGGRTEAAFAIILVAMVLADHALRLLVGFVYIRTDPARLAIDVLAWIGFLHFGLRSRARWPLWVIGFQTVAILAHVVRAIDPGIHPAAYRVLQVITSWPMIFALLAGTITRMRNAANPIHPFSNDFSPDRNTPAHRPKG